MLDVHEVDVLLGQLLVDDLLKLVPALLSDKVHVEAAVNEFVALQALHNLGWVLVFVVTRQVHVSREIQTRALPRCVLWDEGDYFLAGRDRSVHHVDAWTGWLGLNEHGGVVKTPD